MKTLRRRHWTDVLKRNQPVAEAAGSKRNWELSDTELWDAHAQASGALEQANAISERMASSAVRHRTHVDGAMDRSQVLATRCVQLIAGTQGLSETLDRLRVIALNVGLEGARTSESQGRALTLVSEEVRDCASQGMILIDELFESTRATNAEANDIQRDLTLARSAAAEIVHDSAQLRTSADQGRAAMSVLAGRLKKATGLDPEMARALSLASEHARGLFGALSLLTTAAQAPMLSALKPVIAPLAQLISEIGSSPRTDDAKGGNA